MHCTGPSLVVPAVLARLAHLASGASLLAALVLGGCTEDDLIFTIMPPDRASAPVVTIPAPPPPAPPITTSSLDAACDPGGDRPAGAAVRAGARVEPGAAVARCVTVASSPPRQ